ncbi:guanylate kinase [Leuconostocaceae bacterium ESL0723]|nr:guanylate kinase [Leuconostocaceae bacterium ESL0723]
MQQRKVIVITGTAGVGKTTVAHYLKRHYQVPQVITHTTRPPRQGEVPNQDYYFESPASFDQKHYLESVDYAGAKYGSSYEGLEQAWAHHRLVSIVLDTAGALSYCQKLPAETIVLFITVSHPKLAQQRLHLRPGDPKANHQRINSDEFKRDITLPAELAGKATVINNDDWASTKAVLDRLIKSW